MGKATSAPGHFLIPTAPVVGTTVAQSASANTFGSYVQMIASTAAALFITGIYIELSSGANLPTYVAFEIGVGGAGSEVLTDTGEVPFGPSSGVAATQATVYKPIYPPVPVANAQRIAVKTASSIASALGWNVTLECIAQTNVVDDTIPESVSVAQWKGTVPASLAGGLVPAALTAASGTASAGAAASITLAGASATDSIYNDQIVQLIGGTGNGQSRLISAYVGATKVASVVPNWVTAPDNTSVYVVLAAGRVDIATWLGSAPNALISGRVDANMQAVAASLLPIKKNTALAGVTFAMFDSTDGRTEKTGLTVTAQHSIDGAALANCTNAVSEVSNGIYKIDLSAADLNGNSITFRMTATGADPTKFTVFTQG